MAIRDSRTGRQVNMHDPDKKLAPIVFPVSIIVRWREARDTAWSDGYWEVTGMVAAERGVPGVVKREALHSGSQEAQYLWSGLQVSLYRDDAESYYFNIVSDRPRAFVISRQEEGEAPEPFLATLSYDEAASYMEVDDVVDSVDMPPELYRQLERFVLEHYVPERKKKRKRDDWKKEGRH